MMRRFPFVAVVALLTLFMAACVPPPMDVSPTSSPAAPGEPGTPMQPAAPTPPLAPSPVATVPVGTPAPAQPSTPVSSAPPGVAAVVPRLAAHLGVAADAVQIVSYEAVDWPDACLGVSIPDVMCAQVITPGYRIIVRGPDGEYELHSDEAGRSVRIAKPAPGLITSRATPETPTGDPVVLWERSGGIAGICQRLAIYADGAYRLNDCKRNVVINEGALSEADRAQLDKWAETYAPFTWEFVPPQGSADMFNDRYTFAGRGTSNPTEDEKTALNEYLSGLVTRFAIQ